MTDKLTAAEYQQLIKNKAISQQHYSVKDLYETESEKKFTEHDMIEFAMWFSDKNCNYRDLQKYLTINKSIMQSQKKK